MSVSALFTGWIIYDGLWRTLGERNPRARDGALDRDAVRRDLRVHAGLQRPRRVHADRRADRHADDRQRVDGASCRRSTSSSPRRKAGKEQDPTLSIRAKQRSIHNNYLTFPLLFIMVSNHFPAATSHQLNWLILIAVMIGGAGVRHFMNIRYRGGGKSCRTARGSRRRSRWARSRSPACIVITRIDVAHGSDGRPARSSLRARAGDHREALRAVPQRAADRRRFPVAPAQRHVRHARDRSRLMAARINDRAVEHETMPFINKTGMTDEERAELGAWIDDGASSTRTESRRGHTAPR